MLVRHEFGPEGTAYVRSYLESNESMGKRLGRLLLAHHHDLDGGIAWAFLPADSPLDRRTAFEEGGLSPASAPSWEDRVAGWLLHQLRQQNATAWLGGATWRPDVGIVTTLPQGTDRLINRESLSLKDLEEMAVNAAVIVVGAWDDEAFFFWQPSGG